MGPSATTRNPARHNGTTATTGSDRVCTSRRSGDQVAGDAPIVDQSPVTRILLSRHQTQSGMAWTQSSLHHFCRRSSPWAWAADRRTPRALMEPSTRDPMSLLISMSARTPSFAADRRPATDRAAVDGDGHVAPADAALGARPDDGRRPRPDLSRPRLHQGSHGLRRRRLQRRARERSACGCPVLAGLRARRRRDRSGLDADLAVHRGSAERAGRHVVGNDAGRERRRIRRRHRGCARRE